MRDGAPVPGIASADFKGAVSLVNVWASWCVPCHDEAPLLMQLADDKRIRIIGINYKDQPENARRFIGRYGNPFAAVGADANGRASIDWGVYGVPETFVIGRDGRIAYKLVGPISADNLETTLKPQLEKALAAYLTKAARGSLNIDPGGIDRIRRRAAGAGPRAGTGSAATAPQATQSGDDEVGNVASVQGNATATRNGVSRRLNVQDPIFKGDLLRTGATASLGITFDDETTFNLSANATITVDEFVYEEGGKNNSALFKIARGTVAFAAHQVAKTGDMKIETPTSTLGIRGTSGVVEVPEGATPGTTGEVAVKLYADEDGRVGRIELFGAGGGPRLGLLTQAGDRICGPRRRRSRDASPPWR